MTGTRPHLGDPTVLGAFRDPKSSHLVGHPGSRNREKIVAASFVHEVQL